MKTFEQERDAAAEAYCPSKKVDAYGEKIGSGNLLIKPNKQIGFIDGFNAARDYFAKENHTLKLKAEDINSTWQAVSEDYEKEIKRMSAALVDLADALRKVGIITFTDQDLLIEEFRNKFAVIYKCSGETLTKHAEIIKQAKELVK